MATGKAGAQQQITAAERQRKALELRKGGASLRSIADALNCSPATVHGDIAAALAALAADTRAEAEQLRALEVARLDAVMMGHWTAATARGDVDSARIVLRCIEQRAKLLGLNAQPDAPNLGDLLDIVLRWSNGNIIDVTPAPGGDAPALAPGADERRGEPGPLPHHRGGEALGEVSARLAAMPGDGLE